MLAGEPAGAERHLREGYRLLESMGERALLSTTAAFLAQAVLAQGRDDEAGAARVARRGDDRRRRPRHADALARRAGPVLAARGEIGEALALAGEAVALSERSDFLSQRGDVQMDLASVLRAAGRAQEAAAALAAARALYAAKGNLVAAAAAGGLAPTGPGLRASP